MTARLTLTQILSTQDCAQSHDCTADTYTDLINIRLCKATGLHGLHLHCSHQHKIVHSHMTARLTLTLFLSTQDCAQSHDCTAYTYTVLINTRLCTVT